MSSPTGGGREWEDLFHRVLDGGGTAEEIARLHRLLAQNPEAMDDWIRLTHLHAELAAGGLLECGGGVVRVERFDSRDAVRPPASGSNPLEAPRRRQWGRVAAALVAGLLLGGFGNSVLRAVSEPRLGKLANLLADSFESKVPPVVSGPLEETGRWSGDFTELVGAQQGVQPRSGKKMLRLVSSSFEGKAQESESYIADVYRLLDVRPFAKELASGDLILRFATHLNACASADQKSYVAGIYLHALSEETVRRGWLKGNVHELVRESLAVSISNTPLDSDPATWQRGAAELRVPPRTEFVWVHLTLTHPGRRSTDGPKTFSGHYIDDVEAVLTR